MTDFVRSYHAARIDHPEWPARPDVLHGWISWSDFFGVPEKRKPIRDINILKQAIRDYGIQPGTSVEEVVKKNEKIKKISLSELKREVQKLGITDFKKYQEEAKIILNGPADQIKSIQISKVSITYLV